MLQGIGTEMAAAIPKGDEVLAGLARAEQQLSSGGDHLVPSVDTLVLMIGAEITGEATPNRVLAELVDHGQQSVIGLRQLDRLTGITGLDVDDDIRRAQAFHLGVLGRIARIVDGLGLEDEVAEQVVKQARAIGVFDLTVTEGLGQHKEPGTDAAVGPETSPPTMDDTPTQPEAATVATQFDDGSVESRETAKVTNRTQECLETLRQLKDSGNLPERLTTAALYMLLTGETGITRLTGQQRKIIDRVLSRYKGAHIRTGQQNPTHPEVIFNPDLKDEDTRKMECFLAELDDIVRLEVRLLNGAHPSTKKYTLQEVMLRLGWRDSNYARRLIGLDRISEGRVGFASQIIMLLAHATRESAPYDLSTRQDQTYAFIERAIAEALKERNRTLSDANGMQTPGQPAPPAAPRRDVAMRSAGSLSIVFRAPHFQEREGSPATV